MSLSHLVLANYLRMGLVASMNFGSHVYTVLIWCFGTFDLVLGGLTFFHHHSAAKLRPMRV
jgi:hypothetical protein